MAATPALAIPYPIGTDRVMDGDNAMQAIAERVEALLEARPRGVLGSWTALPGTSTPTQSAIDVFGSHTVPMVNGRQYRVTAFVNIARTVAGDYSAATLLVAGVVWHQTYGYHTGATQVCTLAIVSYINGTGPTAIAVQAVRAAGNGSISVAPSGTISSNVLIVEDMGPVPTLA